MVGSGIQTSLMTKAAVAGVFAHLVVCSRVVLRRASSQVSFVSVFVPSSARRISIGFRSGGRPMEFRQLVRDLFNVCEDNSAEGCRDPSGKYGAALRG
jgi:hypothetical protein